MTTPSGRRLVAIGGGSGLAVLLRGLKHHVGGQLEDLSAIVTVSDDGGSSGRLRQEFGVLPPGDIRNCLAALADDEDLVTRLFQYRFANGAGLTGHSFGNLLLTALTGITGDFYQAILTAESILSVRGKILPATLTDVRLEAVSVSGRRYEGESAIGEAGEELRELALRPPNPVPFPPVLESISAADLIVLGPGSLFTSIMPNLLIKPIRDAVRASSAPVVLPLNLMTQPGETDSLDALEHLTAIERHGGGELVDIVLVNTTPLPAQAVEQYEIMGSRPVAVDQPALEQRGINVVGAELLSDGDLVRHDPDKLSAALLGLGMDPD